MIKDIAQAEAEFKKLVSEGKLNANDGFKFFKEWEDKQAEELKKDETPKVVAKVKPEPIKTVVEEKTEFIPRMDVNIPNYHANPKDSQVIICITGSPEQIKKKLQKLANEVSIYGKPIQENSNSLGLETYVRTPVWDKRPA